MHVNITAVNRKERVSNRTGKPFTSLGLKTKEHNDKWLSGFDNETTKDWKAGDMVEIEVEQKGEYLNFTTPKKTGLAPNSPVLSSDPRIINMLELKVIPALQMISEELVRIGKIVDNKADDFTPPGDESGPF